MNLAQLIDPERDLNEERRPSRPAPCPPMGVITHSSGITQSEVSAAEKRFEQPQRASYGAAPVERPAPAVYGGRRLGVAAGIRRYLASVKDGSLDEIAAAVSNAQITQRQVWRALNQLHHGAQVRSAGTRGALRYSLTPRGRAMAPPP